MTFCLSNWSLNDFCIHFVHFRFGFFFVIFLFSFLLKNNIIFFFVIYLFLFGKCGSIFMSFVNMYEALEATVLFLIENITYTMIWWIGWMFCSWDERQFVENDAINHKHSFIFITTKRYASVALLMQKKKVFICTFAWRFVSVICFWWFTNTRKIVRQSTLCLCLYSDK